MKKIIFKVLPALFLTFGLFSCKTAQTSVSNQQSEKINLIKTAQMQVKSLQATDLQEDLSFADELTLAYSMTVVNENNLVTQTVNGSWGVQKVKKKQLIAENEFKPIEIIIPEKSKLLTSVVLVEVDDYEKAKKTVAQINELGGLAQIPATLIELGSMDTPLSLILLGLKATGTGLKIIDHFDKDDVLGQNTFTLTQEDLKKGQTLYSIPLTFKGGKTFVNTYHYDLAYLLKISLLPQKN